MTHQQYNPIYRCAAQAFYPDIDNLWVHPVQDESAMINDQLSNAKEARMRKLRVRNKFWLLITLARNPELAKLRKWRLAQPESKASSGGASWLAADALGTFLSGLSPWRYFAREEEH